ncbi:MAG: 50S ribosomal protein L22 [Planctomycetota bacterium]|nr:50S ribosomal protein L22 [Planctomycetota bacterium]MDI6788868.1 50S ribosomal protein L22 [Planctomycetota bacterium]
MEYRVTLRYTRNTPRKLRLVADMIRSKPIPQAQRILKFTPKKASYFLNKLVNSALSNATAQDANITPENLYISKITVGDGPSFKRLRPASMGKAVQIKRRTSHITLVVETVPLP